MWVSIILGLIVVSSATAIRVPVDGAEENERDSAPIVSHESPSDHIYYNQDNINLNTYLIPPEPQRQEEVIVDVIATPATYLLPPSIDKQSGYQYEGTGTDQQTDWYPIAQLSQSSPDVVPIILPELNETEALEIIRNGKLLQNGRFSIPPPSTVLEPPAPDAPNDYLVPDEPELLVNVNPRLKLHQIVDHRRPMFNLDQNRINLKQKFVNQVPPLHIIPHKPTASKYKTPTKLYPKKYAEGFKPIPIPVSQFAEDPSDEVPRARPLKPFHPILSVKDEYQTPYDDQKVYLYEQTEKKRKLKDENSDEQQHSTMDNNYDGTKSTEEQQTSESHLRYPERNVYSAPLRQEPSQPVVGKNNKHAPPPAGERTEFRMHGMKGPHSYQFGYDTGKGKNRQFRYEERDNDGHVRGHYGYMERNGKLRVVNYDADPEHGFRAEAPVEKEP